IREEAERIDLINSKKKMLNKINLLEGKDDEVEDLYKWSTLFNKSRPISAYTNIKPTRRRKYGK
ncbi:MAG: hypothetical protein MJ252_23940, partial [archaeon]|nr:hypothetical protein [archaeon]